MLHKVRAHSASSRPMAAGTHIHHLLVVVGYTFIDDALLYLPSCAVVRRNRGKVGCLLKRVCAACGRPRCPIFRSRCRRQPQRDTPADGVHTPAGRHADFRTESRFVGNAAVVGALRCRESNFPASLPAHREGVRILLMEAGVV